MGTAFIVDDLGGWRRPDLVETFTSSLQDRPDRCLGV